MTASCSGIIDSWADCVQEGYIGLLHAWTKFRPERGVSFFWYARLLVRRRLQKILLSSLLIAVSHESQQLLRQEPGCKSKVAKAAAAAIKLKTDHKALLRYPDRSQGRPYDEDELLQLDAAVCCLRPKDQQIIRLRAYEQLLYPVIGKQLGIDRSAARMRYVEALERLRAVLHRMRMLPQT